MLKRYDYVRVHVEPVKETTVEGQVGQAIPVQVYMHALSHFPDQRTLSRSRNTPPSQSPCQTRSISTIVQ